MRLTRKQLEADVAFLLLRARAAGSMSLRNNRWTGLSSNALVEFAYGGVQSAMPSDRGDYAACVRTYVRLPAHRKTAAVRAALRKAREAYLANYPDERFPVDRQAKRAEREADRAAWLKRRKRA